jgi:hypothetical protein
MLALMILRIVWWWGFDPLGVMALSGAVPLIFGGESALLPDFWKFLHVSAALYRHFVRNPRRKQCRMQDT